MGANETEDTGYIQAYLHPDFGKLRERTFLGRTSHTREAKAIRSILAMLEDEWQHLDHLEAEIDRESRENPGADQTWRLSRMECHGKRRGIRQVAGLLGKVLLSSSEHTEATRAGAKFHVAYDGRTADWHVKTTSKRKGVVTLVRYADKELALEVCGKLIEAAKQDDEDRADDEF